MDCFIKFTTVVFCWGGNNNNYNSSHDMTEYQPDSSCHSPIPEMSSSVSAAYSRIYQRTPMGSQQSHTSRSYRSDAGYQDNSSFRTRSNPPSVNAASIRPRTAFEDITDPFTSFDWKSRHGTPYQ